jgi:hypothetical protein
MTDRKYLPTFAELVDRLSIVILKSVFISENREAYRAEIALIEHDLDKILYGLDYAVAPSLDAKCVRAILVVMLTNRFIWENEGQAREGGRDVEKLRSTHAVNGIRNTAKNVLAKYFGERVDLKIDCLAANLPAELGNWNVFEDIK